jgi:hypothetical protein
MKTTKLSILILFSLIFHACNKEKSLLEDKKVCCFAYEIEGSFNGQNWERNGLVFGAVAIDATQTIKDTSSIYKCLEGLVDFSLGLRTKEFFGRETLNINRVSKIPKKYAVALTSEYQDACKFSRDSIYTSFNTLAEDGDAGKDSYNKLDNRYPNSFEVMSYDPIKNEFKCRFDFAFIRTLKKDPNYPDTLYLKGKFRIEGRLK